MFYRIKLTKKTDISQCSAKYIVFEASVNVNNVSESVLLKILVLKSQHFHTKFTIPSIYQIRDTKQRGSIA